jgi:hypothetical protein
MWGLRRRLEEEPAGAERREGDSMNRTLRQEIAAIEMEIRAGNSDFEGLCLALAD